MEEPSHGQENCEENGEDNESGETEETATDELDGISILPPDSPELV